MIIIQVERNKDLDLKNNSKMNSSAAILGFLLKLVWASSFTASHFSCRKCIFFSCSQNVWEILTHPEWYGSFCSSCAFCKPIYIISTAVIMDYSSAFTR
jgi:hypothetical protein